MASTFLSYSWLQELDRRTIIIMLQRYFYDINAFSFKFPFNYVLYVFSINFGLLYLRYLILRSDWKCAIYFVRVTLLKQCIWSKLADESLASTIADDSFLFEACGCTMDGKLSIGASKLYRNTKFRSLLHKALTSHLVLFGIAQKNSFINQRPKHFIIGSPNSDGVCWHTIYMYEESLWKTSRRGYAVEILEVILEFDSCCLVFYVMV